MSAPPRTHTPTVTAGALPAPTRSRRHAFDRFADGRLDALLVGAMIVAATILYTVFALRVRGFQPDEWYFTELARMIAHDFPAALWRSGVYLRGVERIDQLVLAIPYALLHTPTSYEVGHALQALLYASAALPVWLLARAGGLGRASAVLAAAVVLAAPWAVISTSFLAEPAAYPAFAWVLYTTWLAAQRPSRAVEVLALVALAVAALTRTQLLALPPILPLAVLWQELRYGLGDGDARERARRLLRRLWSRHPIVTAITALAIVAILASAAGLLPGGGVAKLTGDYGLPHLEPLSAILGRDRYYLSRIATGTGLLAFVFGLGWILRTLARPQRAAGHALAVVCLLGVAGLLLSLLQAGYDERYLFYAAIPIALAFAAEIDSRLRGAAVGIADAVGIALGALAAILLVESVTWPSLAGPYDFFTYPAGVFFGRVVVGNLSLLHVALAPEHLVQVAIVILAVAWIVAGRWRSSRRPGAVVLAVGVLALCVTESYYAFHKYTTGAAATTYVASAAQRSWADGSVPAGASVAQVGIGLGGNPAYTPIWRAEDFWNTSVRLSVAYEIGEMPPVPLDGGAQLVAVESPSGRLIAPNGPAPAPSAPLPAYALMPVQGTNPLALEGTVVAHDPALPVELLHLARPVRALWQLNGTSAEGFMTTGRAVTATVFDGAFGAHPRCASFTLVGPPGYAGHWPFVVIAGGADRTLARGTLAATQRRTITVPLQPVAVRGGRVATLLISVSGQVPIATGALVSAELAFFSVAPCAASGS